MQQPRHALYFMEIFYHHSTVLQQNIFENVVAFHRMPEREREEVTPPTDPER